MSKKSDASETGIRTIPGEARVPATSSAPVPGNDGQHRQRGGGASGDATGLRTVPREFDVGQKRGGDLNTTSR